MTVITEKCQWWCAVLMVVSATACAAPDKGTSTEPAERVGASSQALASSNALSDNSLTTNALWENGYWNNGYWNNAYWNNGYWNNGYWNNGYWNNGYWNNGYWNNGYWNNAYWNNGYWNNGLWSEEFWRTGLAGDAIKDNPSVRQLLQYIYECAMPGTRPDGSSFATTLDPHNGAVTCDTGTPCAESFYTCQIPEGATEGTCEVPLKGGIGLGINANQSTWWESGQCDETCQRWVSACVLARTNAYGVRVEISMRVPNDAPPAIQQALAVRVDETFDEKALFPTREGAFYGNIFATTPMIDRPGFTGDEIGPIQNTPVFFACAGRGSNIPDITKRFCSSQGDQTVINVPGVCLSTALQSGACASIDDEADGAIHECAGGNTTYPEVITVYIHEPIEKCGNAVCETNEEATPERASTCESDCHPGTWGKSWSAQLGGAAMDRRDSSVVIAGTTSAPIKFGDTVLNPIPGRSNDLVIARFRANGAHVWSRRLPNDLGDVQATAVADDGTIVLGGTKLIPGSASHTGWIAKFDGGVDAVGEPTAAAGNMLSGWPVTFGPTHHALGRVDSFDKLAVDHNGNVIGGGSFANTIRFGDPIANPSGVISLTRSVGGFLFRIPAGGGATPDWAIAFPEDNVTVNGLAIDPSNNVLVTLLNGQDSIVYRYAGSTGAQQLRKPYDALNITANGVAADATGVYVTGSGTPFDFGGGLSHTADRQQFFLVKYDILGNYLWHVGEAVNPNAMRNYSSGFRLAFDSNDNVIVGGQWGPRTIDFGTGLLNAYASDDLFLASYAKGPLAVGERRLRWVKHMPMVLAGWFFGSDVDETRVFAAGQFSGSMLVDDRLLISDIPEDDIHYQTFLSSFVLPGTGGATPGTDTDPPVMGDVPDDMVLEAQGPQGAVVWYMPPTATDTGNAGTNVACLPPPNSTFPIATFAIPATVVTCTASDPFGNSSQAQFAVTVRDATPPFMTQPDDVEATATDPGGVPVPFPVPTAQDQVDGVRPVSCDYLSGSVFLVGTTTVTCSSMDTRGNVGEIEFDVIVTYEAPADDDPPFIFVPAPITVEATGPGGATVAYVATAHDDVDGPLTPTCTHPSGIQFGIVTTPVTCSATDAAGNTGSATFQITVRDTTPPNITVPAPITAEAKGPAGAVVAYLASAVDLVDGPVAVSCTKPSGSSFQIATTIVSCTAADSRVNSATSSFPVTVVDTTAPALILPGTITATTTNPGGMAVTYPVSAVDLVDGMVTPDCSPLSGSNFVVGDTTVGCTATDSRGNPATGTFHVVVQLPQAQHSWSGVLQPINADGTSIFKLGKTVPVKFRLTGASAGITDLVATISIAKVTSQVTGTYTEAGSTAATDNGNQFRYDAAAGQYIFNLATNSLTAGTWSLSIDLGDGVSRTVLISLR